MELQKHHAILGGAGLGLILLISALSTSYWAVNSNKKLHEGLFESCVDKLCLHTPVDGDKKAQKNTLYLVRVLLILGALLVLAGLGNEENRMHLLLGGGVLSLIGLAVYTHKLLPEGAKVGYSFYLGGVGAILALGSAVGTHY
jgi:hypothetical protein